MKNKQTSFFGRAFFRFLLLLFLMILTPILMSISFSVFRKVPDNFIWIAWVVSLVSLASLVFTLFTAYKAFSLLIKELFKK